jgi:hypothetical protein
LERWIRWAADDADPKLSSVARAWVASVERQRAGVPLPWTEEREARFRDQLALFEAGLTDPEPLRRRDVLFRLLHLAISEGRTEDLRVRNLFQRATEDADPRVSDFAEFAVAGGLAGDEHALHETHVGVATH